jgi:hypothetical protein
VYHCCALQRTAVDWMGLTLIDRQLEAGKIMYKLGTQRHSFAIHSLVCRVPIRQENRPRLGSHSRTMNAIQETNQHIRDVATCQRQDYKNSKANTFSIFTEIGTLVKNMQKIEMAHHTGYCQGRRC